MHTKLNIAAVALLMVSIAAPAHADCSEVLFASRNYLQQVNDRDAKAWFYNNVCKSSESTTGANFSNLQAAFGFSYGSKDQFCNEEKKNFSDVQHSSIITSTFVEKALDTYYQCKKLERERLDVATKVFPDRVMVDFVRNGATVGAIRGWRVPQGVASCQLIAKDAPSDNVAETQPNFEFIIPNTEKVTLYCARTSVEQPSIPGAKLYPAGQVSVFTSEGNITVPLLQEPLGNTAWANEIASQIAALRNENDAMIEKLKELSGRLQLKANDVLKDEMPFKDHGEKWYEFKCDSGQVMVGYGIDISAPFGVTFGGVGDGGNKMRSALRYRVICRPI